ncbi:hypothetical protein BKA64DRAFT_417804 [Cadophora sp. MPI-SDFR-AT-0126]|nr:hypothetical protein BKA64DRAFT_417804 [Leotiomycetes sp. MPI-SDFR-AT-0126]
MMSCQRGWRWSLEFAHLASPRLASPRLIISRSTKYERYMYFRTAVLHPCPTYLQQLVRPTLTTKMELWAEREAGRERSGTQKSFDGRQQIFLSRVRAAHACPMPRQANFSTIAKSIFAVYGSPMRFLFPCLPACFARVGRSVGRAVGSYLFPTGFFYYSTVGLYSTVGMRMQPPCTL